MHGCGFSLGFFGCLSPGYGRVLFPFCRVWAWLIGRDAWCPVCKVCFARCVGMFYLVGLPAGNCCSCIGLLPFSYVEGAVSFSVSQGTYFL